MNPSPRLPEPDDAPAHAAPRDEPTTSVPARYSSDAAQTTPPATSKSGVAGAAAPRDRRLLETATYDPASDTRTQEPAGASRSEAVPLPEIPDYRVLRRVAQGGMGEVLEARHRVLDRRVAIKMPLPHQISGDADRQRFLREARAAARLRHPHICAIHEVGEAQGRPYIVMDFIEGETLKAWRAARQPTGREAAELMARLARAVDYAHQHGVVHRDLKPSNVIVDRDGGAPVLTDFGLAKQLNEEQNQLTQSGQVMGTPAYMAPEQAAGQLGRVGPRSDVYSLGAILYELLCGCPPFQSANVLETLRQVQHGEPRPPRSLNPRVHRDLETVCLKALAKEPEARYASAAALADDLERFSAGEPIAARRTSAAARLWRRLRRSPATVGAVAVVAVATAAAVYIALGARHTWALAAASQEFEAGLDARDWTPEHLARMEALADGLRPLSATEAAAARERLYQRYAEVQHERLRRATLEPEDEAAVETALGVLDQHAANLAPPLRRALNERKRAWDTVVDLGPATAPDAVFERGRVVRSGERLVPQRPPDATPARAWLVATQAASRGNVELEAVFDPSWQQAAEIGLLLNVEPGGDSAARRKSGYCFRLAPDRSNARDENGSPPPPTFAAARAQEGTLIVEILRGGTRLTRHSLRTEDLPDGPLRLSVSRQGDRLTVQVNERTPIAFQDLFPIARSRAGAFAVLWPEQATLQRLRGRRRAPPAAASSLERGDEAYSRGEFAEALDEYHDEEIKSIGTPAAQEARYKQSLALAALNRQDEAEQLLRALATEPGDRWPVLAACGIWLAQLKARQWAEADAVFEGLSARYSFEQLAALVPDELREQILAAYGAQSAGLNLYSADPNRVRNVQRAVKVEELLGSDIDPLFGAKGSLLRAYEAADLREEAIRLIEEMIGQCDPARVGVGISWVDDYSWLVCLRGEPQRALECLDRVLFDSSGKMRDRYQWLLLGRSRAHVALGKWDEAERDIDDLLRVFDANIRDVALLPMIYVVQGFLREHRGDAEGAMAAWKQGFAVPYAGGTLVNGTTVLGRMMLGSLSGEMSDAEAATMLGDLLDAFARGTPFAAVKGVVKPPASVLRDMWRRPRGREAARRIALHEVAFPETVRLPALVMGLETVREGAFGRELSADEEPLVWKFVEDSFDRHVVTGRLGTAQALNLAMTWKGSTNFLGWAGVSGSLDAEYRALAAWVYGHRFQRLQRPDEATTFFRTAVDDSPPDSPLHRLAQAALPP